MTIAIMGCGSSIYDDPDLVRKQTANRSIIKTSTSGNPVQTHNTHRGDNSHSNITLTSKLKRGKVAPIITADKNSSPNGGHFGTSTDCNNRNNTSYNNLTNHRASSPALSDRTDRTNRSIKRVAFTDQPAVNLEQQDKMMNGVEGDVGTITGSPTDRKRAKRKRERALRKRLLDKMGEAESISERLLLESERLSLTSSMSRATSRTCSPLHIRAYNYEKNTDDNGTEVSSVAPDTPRGAPPPPGEAPPTPVEAPPTHLSEGKDQ